MRSVSAAMARGEDPVSAPVDGSPADGEPPSSTAPSEETFHVFGSGNLGLVYVRGAKQQLTRQQLDERFPALVTGLAGHPGIGFVVVTDAIQGPMVLGANGSRRLRDDEVVGVDPLLPFGELAGGFVRRVASQPETPDIYVNSILDPGTEEVAAFEGLVGCHGGLGGWQDRACIVVPTELPFPEERVVGADALHVALRDILIHLGHRRDLAGLDAQGNGAETPTLASTPTDRTG